MWNFFLALFDAREVVKMYKEGDRLSLIFIPIAQFIFIALVISGAINYTSPSDGLKIVMTICVICFFLLFLAFFWFRVVFPIKQERRVINYTKVLLTQWVSNLREQMKDSDNKKLKIGNKEKRFFIEWCNADPEILDIALREIVDDEYGDIHYDNGFFFWSKPDVNQ